MSNSSISVDNVGVLVELTENGEFLWHRNANEILNDSSYWKDVNPCLYAMIKTLYGIQSEPKDSRTAFMQQTIKMPANLQQGTDEYTDMFNWRLWQAAVSFGNRNLMNLSQSELTSLKIIFGELIDTLKTFITFNSIDSLASSTTINDAKIYVKAAIDLIPIVNKIGVTCNHRLIPTMIDATTPAYTCIDCDEVFEAFDIKINQPENSIIE